MRAARRTATSVDGLRISLRREVDAQKYTPALTEFQGYEISATIERATAAARNNSFSSS